MLRERTVSWEISLGYVLRLSLRNYTKTEREEEGRGGRKEDGRDHSFHSRALWFPSYIQ